MAKLDITALQNKLNRFTKQTSRKDDMWKPEGGQTVIRIVPWKEDPTNPFIERQFHYFQNKTYQSPMSYGEADPINEFGQELLDNAGDDSEARREAWQVAKQFFPKARTFVPVVVRGEEDKGVRFWSFGKTVYEQLLRIMTDPEWGDITDVESGTDIVVDYITRENSPTSFPQTKITMRRNSSPLHEDKKTVSKWLEEQPEFDELFTRSSYNELLQVLKRYVDPDGPSSVTQAVTSPSTTSVSKDSSLDDSEAPTEKKTASVGAGSAAAEFDKLFDS